MNKKRIRLDVNNMFAKKVGEENGIEKESIEEYRHKTKQIHNKIQDERENGNMGFMELPYQSADLLDEIKSEAEKRRKEFENFVVIGIGGSALGNIALQTALNPLYYNLDRQKRDGAPRLFVLDNSDPLKIKSLIESIDIKKTLFNVITKSGSTAETMSQFLIAREAVKDVVGEDKLADHFIATTSRNSGFLKEIADREGFKTFYIPENVGGRFSVLTPVGLISAAFCGVDISSLL